MSTLEMLVLKDQEMGIDLLVDSLQAAGHLRSFCCFPDIHQIFRQFVEKSASATNLVRQTRAERLH